MSKQSCDKAREDVRVAYVTFFSELEEITHSHGLLLQEATRSFEEKAAEKLRTQLTKSFTHES